MSYKDIMLNKSVFSQNLRISPETINENFISLFNQPGPYYSSYPVLGEWKNSNSESEYEIALKDYFKKYPDNPIFLNIL